ncbi:RluA family pseudouridine synthase [Alkalibacillus aidingensis]|uniref:RluA family pseudouridine synthase n=1 Tax=Alkalibacillus aidingensis TaxID=2747607 RepID=UPI001660A6A0|nr:RluA family pseudouridine synthase [Alkalibacillus aidingensis]
MKFEWKITRKHEDWLVRDYLLHVRAFSSRLLKQVKLNGEILRNQQHCTVKERLRSGDRLVVFFPPEQISEALQPMELKLNVIYEDPYVLVINKPRGIAVSPNMNDRHRPTLASGVLDYFKQINVESTVHILTRLDKYTSGTVLIAKHRYIHHLLQNEKIERQYVAVVHGQLKQKKGTIDLPIGRNLPSIIERKVTKQGKRAITHYQVVKDNGQDSLVKVKLETGRTHQIRVHLAHLGHPLLGDDLYGGMTTEIFGQALHCQLLAFNHPILNQRIHCYGSFPTEMERLI